MGKIVRRSSLRYLLHRPWQLLLSVLGITVGVAVVVGIDLANQSASRAFKLSMESVSGRATHQIIGGTAGLPDSVFKMVRVGHAFRRSTPVIESYATIPGQRGRTLLLLGIDPFGEAPFRPYLGAIQQNGLNINRLISEPATALLSQRTADALHITPGDSLNLLLGSLQRSVVIIGTLDANNQRSDNALENLIITDLATAQELLNMQGRISRIDLIIENGQELSELAQLLPGGISISPAKTRSQMMSQMTAAFQLNLTALSLLALIVGIFLIYNTMTFSVVQRQTYIGLMRALGLTRKEIFQLILTEAILLGLAGTLFGLLLGIFLGKGLVLLISQTINDLYFVMTVRSFEILPLSLLKGALLGILASLIAALKPASEAARTSPRLAMNRSSSEIGVRKNLRRTTALALACLSTGVVVLMIPTRNIPLSYGGILLLVAGFTFLTPFLMLAMSRICSPLVSRIFGLPGKMALREITSQLSRTTVAVAALSLAVAATIGVGTMVGSFRATVLEWLESRLASDIYISAPSRTQRRSDTTMDPAFVERVASLPQIAVLSKFRDTLIPRDEGILHLVGTDISREVFEGFTFSKGDPVRIWPRFRSEDVAVVSEPYAFRYEVNVGDTLILPGDNGPVAFPVLGIYYDYVSDLGVVLMHLDRFRQYWLDPGISGASVLLKPGVSIDSSMAAIRNLAAEGEEIFVRSNRSLRESTIEVFDRTFLITNVLRILTIIVAFIGVLSALMSLQLERRRQLGILRASGLTVAELWQLITLETGMMGLFAGLLSLPLGTMLSYVLIYIINRRSFGWTLQFEFIPHVFIQALLLAVLAAIIAGIYPAFKMAKLSPALALREE